MQISFFALVTDFLLLILLNLNRIQFYIKSDNKQQGDLFLNQAFAAITHMLHA